jgi:hypothetical protein
LAEYKRSGDTNRWSKGNQSSAISGRLQGCSESTGKRKMRLTIWVEMIKHLGFPGKFPKFAAAQIKVLNLSPVSSNFAIA